MPALEVLDGAAVRRWCAAATDALGAATEQINALNVFPVADRDTGTNLHLTMLSAMRALDEVPAGAGPREIWHGLAHGALLGAQGNSGIIVSQFMRGLADMCARASRCDGAAVREGLAHAARLSRAAVGHPVEGTVLSVATAAAEAAAAAETSAVAAVAEGGAAAQATAAAGNGLAAVTRAAADGARQALMRTTAQLEVLARAGVVDAGAAGLCLVLDALAAVVAGTVPGSSAVPSPAVPQPVPPPGPGPVAPRGPGLPRATGPAPLPATATGRVLPADGVRAAASGGHSRDPAAYEVMYLLEAADVEVARLRDRLGRLGDSVVVVGGAGLWNVHVHAADAGAAIEAGMAAGRPRRIRVNYLAIPGGAGDAAERCDAHDEAPAAHGEAPGTQDGRGSATLSQTGFGGDVAATAGVATAARWGEVIWLSPHNAAATGAEAAAPAVQRAGNAIGRIGGDVVASGEDAAAVGVNVAERLLALGGYQVTLLAGTFAGTHGPDGNEVADVVAARIEETRPGVEIIIHEAGGPGCVLLIGVA